MTTKKKIKKRHFPRVQTVVSGPSLTKQAFRKECDINHIMKVYKNHGVLTHVNERRPEYGDVTSVPDYHAAQQLMIDSQNNFDLLPSLIRERFDNDPALLLEFLNDDANYDESVFLGIRDAPEVIEEIEESPKENIEANKD